MSETATEELTTAERNELMRMERIAEESFGHMKTCAEALRTIRDKRLYRGEFETFKDYCLKKWGKQRSTVYMLLQAWDAKEEMSNALDTDKPLQTLAKATSEKAFRALAKVPKRSRKRVFKEAVKKTNGKPPTEKAIKEASRGVCSEFGDGQSYRGQSLANFYASGSTKADSKPCSPPDEKDSRRWPLAPSLTKQRVLDAFDQAANWREGEDVNEMLSRIRRALEAL
jgi:hypothetical protein